MRDDASTIRPVSAQFAAPANSTAGKTRTGSALRNALWLGGDKAVSVVAGLVVFGLIARAFGPEGSGHLAFAMAVLQTALGLSLVCSAAALLPRLCRQVHAVAGMLANVFVVRLLASTLAAAIAAIAVLIFVDEPVRRNVTLIVLITVPLIEPFYLASTYWQSRNANRVPVLSRSTGILARLALVALAVWLGAPLWVIALAWILEACITAMLQAASLRGIVQLHHARAQITKQRLATYLNFGARFLVGLWLSHLYLRLDRLVLSELLSVREYGIYAAAMQLVEVWLQVATLLGLAVGPAFLYANLRRGGLAAQWRVFALMAAIGFFGFVGVYLVGQHVLMWVFGAPFAASYPYLLAGAAFGVLFFADQVVQLAVTAANQPRELAVRWAAACIVALAAQLLLFNFIGPYAGIAGLALGLIASWAALFWLWRLRLRKTATTEG
jgi:polysaccharide transporter, PST family